MTDEHDDLDEDVDVFEQPVTEQLIDADQRWVTLPTSTMLQLEGADELLRRRPASVVAIVGERNGGKTTLVSEIYERFLRGSFADSLFCQSLSLSGFERKSFLSRAESGAEHPDTPRTSAQDGLSFFHLAVAPLSAPKNRVDILISERAGETYRGIRDNPDRAAEMIELCKADAIAFIIDGERVLDPRMRAEVFASARHIIRALHGAGTIKPASKVQLVTTKLDLLSGDQAGDALAALTDFENRIIASFGEIYSISAFRTAARDPKGNVEPGTGLAPLFLSWVTPLQPLPMDEVAPPILTDEFDRLLLRRAL